MNTQPYYFLVPKEARMCSSEAEYLLHGVRKPWREDIFDGY